MAPGASWEFRSGSQSNARLVAVTRSGSARVVAEQPGRLLHPRLSPDGRRVALTAGSSSDWGDIWVYDLVAGNRARLTTDGINGRPEWLDDRTLAYISSRSRGAEADAMIRASPRDASRPPSVLLESEGLGGIWEITFGKPGGHAVVRTGPAVEREFRIAPMATLDSARPLLNSAGQVQNPRISPDGQLLAYDDGGQVYVQPLADDALRVQVSAGGRDPAWAPDGDESVLFYRSATHVVAATLQRLPELDVIRRDTLFADPYLRSNNHSSIDVFPGGDEFLMVEPPVVQSTTHFVVLNWTEALRRALGGPSG